MPKILNSTLANNPIARKINNFTKTPPDFIIILIGSGKLFASIKEQIDLYGLSNIIITCGAIPHNEIPMWMNACDLFVLPSLSESFGIVQIEALACGKPVVATRNGGSEEVLISDEYGLLVEPANPEDLAEKIIVALDREWDTDKILAYAEQFTWENIAKKIVGVYEQVLGRD